MKALIVCFSQTGNTRKIAENIQSGIRRSGHDCDIVSIKHVKNEDLYPYDLIGIGTPTFYYREPLNVKRFIDGLDKTDGKHCFLFCTHGSIIGNTFFYMQEGLNEKGYKVIDAWDTYADSSLPFYPEVMHTAGHPDSLELSCAEEFGADIFNKSLAIKNGDTETMPVFSLVEDTWWAQDAQMLIPEYLKQFFPKFEIQTEKCTQCMQCQENCPVDAVDLDAQPPEIQKDGCIYCLYCEKQCPEGAIEADWRIVTRMVRPNLEKYVEVLKVARQKGIFRPYVDFENIV